MTTTDTSRSTGARNRARARGTEAAALTTRVVTGDGLTALEADWERCRAGADEPAWTQHYELFRDWTPGQRGVVVAEEAGVIVGLAPFTREIVRSSWHLRTRSERRPVMSFPIEQVRLIGPGLAAPPDPRVQAALYDGLLDAAADADTVRFRDVPDGSPLAALVARTRSRPGTRWLPFTDVVPEQHHRRALGTDLRTYLEPLMSTSSRRYLERDARRIQRHPDGSTCEVFTERADMARMADLIERIDLASWHAKRQEPTVRDGTRARLEAWARLGIVRGYVLSIGDQPVAFVLGYVSDGCYHVAKLGHAEQWARRSPGKVVLWQVLDDLHRLDDVTAIDLGRGTWGFKESFAGTPFPVRDTVLVRPRLRAAPAIPPLLWRRARTHLAAAAEHPSVATVKPWIRRNLAR